MPLCDLCGKDDSLLRAEIEGSQLNVCQNCGKFGKVLGKVAPKEEAKKPAQLKSFIEKEIEERIISSYAQTIRKVREKRGLTVEDFAKLLNEKESSLHKWESGSIKPDLETAKKLEKILNITLIELVEEQKIKLERTNSGEITLGDVIKIRKRK